MLDLSPKTKMYYYCRERLIGLLRNGLIATGNKVASAEHIADHLISNYVITVPCYAGDRVYWIIDGKIVGRRVRHVELYYSDPNEDGKHLRIAIVTGDPEYHRAEAVVDDFEGGRTVYFSRDDAEKELLKGGQNEIESN